MPRCYICNPRGKVLQHLIKKTLNYSFYHDMTHRPVILISPNKHINNIYEIENLKELNEEIHKFCDEWNIKDYQVSYNVGSWQKQEHLHIKIRVNDKIIGRMRGDHFRRIKLEQAYKSNPNPLIVI